MTKQFFYSPSRQMGKTFLRKTRNMIETLDYLDEFQVAARRTAVYPANRIFRYPATGLLGEVGELANKIKKVYRDDAGTLSPEVRDSVVSELGDCLWYAAATASDYGLSLTGTCELKGDIRSREDESEDLDYYVLCMGDSAGRLCGVSTMVANDGVFFDDTRREVQSALNAFVSYAISMAYLLETDLEQVCKTVIAKLQSRAERGTLHGSGDDR